MKKLFILLFLFILGMLSAQVTLEILPQGTVTYNSFYPVNFDPDHPEEQPILFTITLNSDVGNDYILKVSLESENTPPANITLAPITDVTPPFISLTNRDIVNEDPNYFVIDGNYDDFLDALDDQILETGRLPDDSYLFTIEAKSPDGSSTFATVQITLDIVSPITISLISPGSPIGSTPIAIFSQYPNFTWFSNITSYKFELYELDDIPQNTEDVIQQNNPIFIEEIESTSFTYPPSAPSFNLGKYYAWQITGDIVTTAGNTTGSSIMYCFEYEEQGSGDFGDQTVINFLNQLGTDEINQIISYLESGYTVQGITWQGEEITTGELNNITQQILMGEIEFKDVSE